MIFSVIWCVMCFDGVVVWCGVMCFGVLWCAVVWSGVVLCGVF